MKNYILFLLLSIACNSYGWEWIDGNYPINYSNWIPINAEYALPESTSLIADLRDEENGTFYIDLYFTHQGTPYGISYNNFEDVSITYILNDAYNGVINSSSFDFENIPSYISQYMDIDTNNNSHNLDSSSFIQVLQEHSLEISTLLWTGATIFLILFIAYISIKVFMRGVKSVTDGGGDYKWTQSKSWYRDQENGKGAKARYNAERSYERFNKNWNNG